MSFSRVYSAQINILDGQLITVETDISRGLHNFAIVGLADKAVDESRDRVGAAIKNSGLKSPKQSNQKIVISLSPANLKKEGSYFDLAIALGYMLSNDEIKFDPEGKIFLGELALNGELKAVKGILSLVKSAKALGFTEIFVPEPNAKEAALIDGITIYPVKNLIQVVEHLDDKKDFTLEPQPATEIIYEEPKYAIDFSDVRGQELAKRGLEIAAAGAHNIAMYGPPGTGKTMLARAFSSILPQLSKEDVLEVTAIHSIVGILEDSLVTSTPFRSPHSTSSYVSVIGGGTYPKPGEVTLAHKGVLFLDEFPEFDRRVLESLRQPLEDRVVNIARARGSATYPTNFILIAAMNPPPQNASAAEIVRYQKKISGPILDRIDMWVNVLNIDYDKLGNKQKEGEESKVIKERVLKARNIQKKRLEKSKANTNAEMGVKDIDKLIELKKEVKDILNDTAKRLGLSARAYHRVVKLARTIADLEGSEHIEMKHILEALQYRPRQE